MGLSAPSETNCIHSDLWREATYRLIGTAYAEVEKKEPWCDHVEAVADVAVLAQEAVFHHMHPTECPPAAVLEGKHRCVENFIGG